MCRAWPCGAEARADPERRKPDAVPVEVAEIKQLADVERVDLSTMKKFSSGMSAVNVYEKYGVKCEYGE